jgi:sugar lactone lactonase YvrE
MARELTVLAGGFAFLEGPRWHDGYLYTSDFYTYRTFRIDLEGNREKLFDMPGQPSGMGWLPNGDLVINSMRDRKVMRWDGRDLSVHADLWDVAESHLNDMVVDTQGRAYVGNFGVDHLAGEPMAPATVVRVDPDGTITPLVSGLHGPNGMAITADGRTMFMSESTANRVSRFDITEDGALVNQRTYYSDGDLPKEADTFVGAIQNGELHWVPDGMCIDAEDAIWVADAIGRRALRIKDGEVVEELSSGDLELGIVSCALGGEDGRTLFLCAAPGFGEEACKASHDACILTTRVEVPHAGRP